jgi:hypothetical protein
LCPGYHVIDGFGKGGSNAGYIVVQPDGNLVEYTPDGKQVVWGSNTANSGATYLVVQNDGNVVLYRADNTPVWGSGTAGKS